ncbi:O-antigen ligase family protein [Hyunsoonleella sp. SJ7]|uniref:O-antigen ligase family protein n=1 Tax=Hyunsoonleella aquatilis TaxID=2762758 RepID=A0A923H8D2_9FLAO|nr:O-antigen ligase family protein [Hyunsoonleella aquatilis]MBC3758986.1 O-antigen ligase family protein [Hyunsoonleella aquatilis]
MKYILGTLLILFASYADIFLHRIHIIPVPPASFLIPLFFGLFIMNYSIKDFSNTFKSHSFKFLLFIIIISIVYSALTRAEMFIITQEIVLNIITLILYSFALHFFTVESKEKVLFVVGGALLVLGGSLLYDFFIGLPEYSKKLSEAVRKGGFGENPNQAASGIKFLALCVLVLVNKNKTWRYLVIVFMLVAVFLTLSRSGMASVILILIFGTMNEWSSEFKIKPRTVFVSGLKLVLMMSILFMALVSFSEVIKENFPEFSRGAAGERMDMFLGKSKVTIDEGGRAGGRSLLLVKYWNEFQDNPLGYGTGYTADQRFNHLNTHNYFLSLAVNFGILTLIVFLIYLVYGIKLAFETPQAYYAIFVALIVFEGFIAHNIWYTRTLIICLAFFDSTIYRKKIYD